MPLQPVLLVGVGGSGSKALRTLRQTLLRRLRASGWTENDLPDAWQMVALDTITVASADGYPEPLLPGSQYLGMTPPGLPYGAIVKNLVQGLPADKRQAAFGGWMTDNIPGDVAFGAGANRAVGRAVAAFALDQARKRMEEAYQMCRAPGSLAQLANVQSLLTGSTDAPESKVMAFVITSVAGGTGSGMFVDVVEALTAVDAEMGLRAQVILFGPDIFGPILHGAGGAGIAANTLAAIGSVTSGMWNSEPSSGTAALYASKGLVASKEGAGLMPTAAGSRYNYVLGAVNANGAPVGTMEDAYRAAGDSLAAIISDPRIIENFNNFFRINVFENSWIAAQVGDKSGLNITNDERYTQPFGSFGSAKVSLGTQRFAEYASQAIARSTIERLLWPALEIPDPNETRPDAVLVRDEASALWANFLSRSGLDERDDRDDVVDALLSPEVEPGSQGMAASLMTKASAGAGGKGLAPAVWLRNIQTYLDVEMQAFLDEARSLRAPIARTWVDDRKQAIVSLVSAVCARAGMAVAADLVGRLREETRTVAETQLTVESATARRSLDELPGHLSQALNAAGMTTLPADNPAIVRARGLLAKAAVFQEAAVRYALAAELLLDLEENFLGPLQEALVNGRTELLQRVNAAQLDDGRPNPFVSYPRLDDYAGQGFRPGPTELLLIDPDSYPELLEERTKASLEGEHVDDWKMKLLTATVDGVGLSGEERVQPFFSIEQQWTTRVAEAQSATAGLPAPAKFSTVVQPDVVVERARLIIEDPDTAVGKFLGQSLSDFLNVADPGHRHTRRVDFVAKLTQAFVIGAPLAEENTILIQELHPELAKFEGGFHSTVSPIPIDQGDDLYEQIKSALVGIKAWNDKTSPGWFSSTKAPEINIFQASRSAMSAMALTSLMEPVFTRWHKISTDPDSRKGFWQLKRARPLAETIPVAPEILLDIAEGWFAAGLLGQRQTDSPSSELGYKSSIWSPTDREWIDFPYPMLGTDGGGMNQLPGVLMSLLIAMAECNQVSSLRPLRAYQRLAEIGRQLGGPADSIAQWISSGSVPSGAPQPPEKFAGSASGTLDERQKAVSVAVTKSLDIFEQHFSKVEATGDPFQVDLIWELRDLVREAHRELLRVVSEVSDSSEVLG